MTDEALEQLAEVMDSINNGLLRTESIPKSFLVSKEELKKFFTSSNVEELSYIVSGVVDSINEQHKEDYKEYLTLYTEWLKFHVYNKIFYEPYDKWIDEGLVEIAGITKEGIFFFDLTSAGKKSGLYL
jgi:hypothetical protein